jgi:hypothetical protein
MDLLSRNLPESLENFRVRRTSCSRPIFALNSTDTQVLDFEFVYSNSKGGTNVIWHVTNILIRVISSEHQGSVTSDLVYYSGGYTFITRLWDQIYRLSCDIIHASSPGHYSYPTRRKLKPLRSKSSPMCDSKLWYLSLRSIIVKISAWCREVPASAHWRLSIT